MCTNVYFDPERDLCECCFKWLYVFFVAKNCSFGCKWFVKSWKQPIFNDDMCTHHKPCSNFQYSSKAAGEANRASWWKQRCKRRYVYGCRGSTPQLVPRWTSSWSLLRRQNCRVATSPKTGSLARLVDPYRRVYTSQDQSTVCRLLEFAFVCLPCFLQVPDKNMNNLINAVWKPDEQP